MMTRIDLIWLGHAADAPDWRLGAVHTISDTPEAVAACIRQRLPNTQSDAWLFWHSSLGAPDPEKMAQILTLPGEVWHGGLKLGMSHQPGVMDFVSPGWMLNCDPDPTVEATSWRISLRACLILTDVLRQMESISPDFTTLEGASLELGHRYITRGVIVRHIPWMITYAAEHTVPPMPIEDELRFVRYRFGRRQIRWALMRMILSRYAPVTTILKAWRCARRGVPPADTTIYQRLTGDESLPSDPRVTVLIPTVDRYPYLRTLLSQLRGQTIQAHEIIVIDQTQSARRDLSIADDFTDLPLQFIYQDEPGQCTSRNAGLQVSTGDYILFIDDDDEVQPDLIESHLRHLHTFRLDVSSGSQEETGALPLPEHFRYARVSDVFPTNNTLIRRDVLYRSGLFDLAYNRRQRADADLGIRAYRSGALMVYNPQILVFHHHAPSGGLRVHRARVITYSSSRQHLFHRHLASVSEIYLAMRYFTPRQVQEGLWLRIWGTFGSRGSRPRKLLKLMVSAMLLPDSVWRTWKRRQQAKVLLREYPQIPLLAAVSHMPDAQP